MKNVFFILSIIAIFSLSSCATKMTVENTAKIIAPEGFSYSDEPDMEFIGFKADTSILSTINSNNVIINGMQSRYQFMPEFEIWKAFKNESQLKHLGSILETNNIAYDKSFAYFGIYSLQELELYKTKNDLYIAMKKVFDEAGIEIPYNQLDVKIKDNA